MQKTKGCLQRARTESEEYAGVQTVIGISHESLAEVNLSSEMLLETIMSRGNMNAAYKRVMSNKGSGGVDKMGLDELLPYLKSHGEELTASILNGRYKPNPVRRVEIPKDNGKKRQLGIPTLLSCTMPLTMTPAFRYLCISDITLPSLIVKDNRRNRKLWFTVSKNFSKSRSTQYV